MQTPKRLFTDHSLRSFAPSSLFVQAGTGASPTTNKKVANGEEPGGKVSLSYTFYSFCASPRWRALLKTSMLSAD